MKEILELMQANGVKKIELIHLVDMTPAMGESDEDVMVVNTIEQDKQGTLVCYDNRDEDEQGKYQPLWNVAQLPKQVQDELLFSVKYTLQQKSESVVGRKVATAKQAEVRKENAHKQGLIGETIAMLTAQVWGEIYEQMREPDCTQLSCAIRDAAYRFETKWNDTPSEQRDGYYIDMIDEFAEELIKEFKAMFC